MKIHNAHLLPPSRPPDPPAEPSPHAAAHLAWVARTVQCPAGCRDENLDCDVCFGRCRVDPADAEKWTGALKLAREAGYAAGQKAEAARCARLCRSIDATERMMLSDGGMPSGLASKCADAILSIGPQCGCGDIMHPAYPPCVQCRKCFGCCLCEAKSGDAARNGTPLMVPCPSCHGDPIDGQWCCGACNGSGRVLARPLIVG